MAETAQKNNGAPPPTSNSPSSNGTYNVASKMVQHVKANKVDVALWATRVITLMFGVFYVLPICNKHSAFSKVLLANAATSALRLHQRLPSFTLSREFLGRLIIEDSCHYLLYSIIFFSVSPNVIILIPPILFAVLHASSYSLKLLDLIGQNSCWAARFLISLVEFQAGNILRAAAFSEIFIMLLAMLFMFTGRASPFISFLYYYFLILRYSSRRNHYSKTAFTQLRMAMESLANRSPSFAGKIIRSIITCVSRLAPALQAVPQH